MKIIYITIVAAVVISAGTALLMHSSARAAALSTMQDCVVSTANAEGYTGNAYSQDAWEFFAPSCI